MTTAEEWHDQWVAATRAMEVAVLDLMTAMRTLPPEQLGSLRRYRERVDEAKRECDRLKSEVGAPPDVSQEWPR